METISLTSYLSSLNCKPESVILDRCAEIGDLTAMRISKQTKLDVRANYERGILLSALANKYALTEFFEIGTGRGFVSGCVAEFCPNISRIMTVDNKNSAEAANLLLKSRVDIRRIRFVSADSLDLTPAIVGGKFDLFFIDGSHEGEDVRKDLNLCLGLAKEKFIVVFDDYSPKFASLKSEIDKFEREGIFDRMFAVQTDGQIFSGETTERLMVVGMKGIQ